MQKRIAEEFVKTCLCHFNLQVERVLRRNAFRAMEKWQGQFKMIQRSHKHLYGPVIRAAVFFNLPRVELQVETLCCAYYHVCDQFVSQQNTVLQVCGILHVQSCVIENGSFFHIIWRFDEHSLRFLAVIFFLFFVPAKFCQYEAQFHFR